MLKVTLFVCLLLIDYTKCDSQTKPNIVLIIADDLGWNDVGFHGSNQIPTPNIDALAYNGIILNRFYTQPGCTPSRAALLTGQYPMRFGYQGMPVKPAELRVLPFNITTLPGKLKQLGYATHLIGKWHLGSAYRNATPLGHGFDSHFGFWNGYMGYYEHENEESVMQGMRGFDMHKNNEPAWEVRGRYVTEMFTEKVEEVIRAHNKSEPLFLVVAHSAPHSGKNKLDMEVPDEKAIAQEFKYIKEERRRLYAGMVKSLDESVGATVQSLSKKGVLQNTILVFFSDNGAPTEGEHLLHNAGSNWPLRGLKFTVFDGGIRVPAIIYSSFFKKSQISNILMHISDLMPTMYEAAGGNENDLGKIDGISQWKTLTKKKKSKRTSLLVNIDEVNNSTALIGIRGRYKLINGSTTFVEVDGGYYGDDGSTTLSPPYTIKAVLNSPANVAIGKGLTEEKIWQIRKKAKMGDCRRSFRVYDSCRHNDFCLFDLLKDPCETTNVAKNNPLVVRNLKRKLASYWNQMQPQKKLYIDPKANPKFFDNSWHTWLDEPTTIAH